MKKTVSKKKYAVVGILDIVLMVVLTVALASAIFFIILPMIQLGPAPPAVSFMGSLDGDTISLTPSGGHALLFNSTTVSVTVNDLTYPVDFSTYLSSSAIDDGQWGGGETLLIDLGALAESYGSSQSVSLQVVDIESNSLIYDKNLRKGSSSPGSIPQVVTLNPTSITFQSAVAQMTYSLEEYSSVDICFQYKLTGGQWTYTPWVQRTQNGVYEYTLTGLTNDQSYQVQAQLRYGSTVISGTDKSFTTTKGPVSLWHLDEGSGSTANDAKGANHGTLIRSPAWVTGVRGNALRFNGVDNYVSVADSASLDLTSQGTIMAWIYIDSHKPWAGIIHKGALRSFTDEAYSLQFYSGTKRVMCGFNDGQRIAQGSTMLDTGIWYHVCGAWDQNTIWVYVDGVVDGSIATNGILPKVTTGSLQIGAQLTEIYNPGLMYLTFDGSIDEVMIFNRVLPADEIRSYYQSIDV
ncbi:MAG: LamG domain-containing protein [Candidatus Thermoplasmatota archaeon]|nr:LamG domain-containing protein [Candidatus Thermoplasmatota archaeon]